MPIFYTEVSALLGGLSLGGSGAGRPGFSEAGALADLRASLSHPGQLHVRPTFPSSRVASAFTQPLPD